MIEAGGYAPAFEQNIEVWRQLWRVLERSDVAVVVVDARNPMLHLPPRCTRATRFVAETARRGFEQDGRGADASDRRMGGNISSPRCRESTRSSVFRRVTRHRRMNAFGSAKIKLRRT